MSLSFPDTPTLNQQYTSGTTIWQYNGVFWSNQGNNLPTQTGNGGKYLTTDGTAASWATVTAGVAGGKVYALSSVLGG